MPTCVMTARSVIAAAFCLALFIGAAASAQEPITSPAATQPSAGRWVLRNQLRYLEAKPHPISGDRDFHEFTLWNNLAYGISGDLSVNLSLPVVHRTYRSPTSGGERDTGVSDLTAMLKWRIHQHDFGPIDTSRFSILLGAEIPTFDSEFSTKSVNPIIGGVYTHVQGRHGFNLSAQYKLTTGTGTAFNLGGARGKADALLYDGSYLFRIHPAAYGPDSAGAWYGLVEVNGIYETNGDNELFISPGMMYEARTWTIEAAVRIPVWQDIDKRPETRFVAYAGLRLLF